VLAASVGGRFLLREQAASAQLRGVQRGMCGGGDQRDRAAVLTAAAQMFY
jgi:hypothetical protein